MSSFPSCAPPPRFSFSPASPSPPSAASPPTAAAAFPPPASASLGPDHPVAGLAPPRPACPPPPPAAAAAAAHSRRRREPSKLAPPRRPPRAPAAPRAQPSSIAVSPALLLPRRSPLPRPRARPSATTPLRHRSVHPGHPPAPSPACRSPCVARRRPSPSRRAPGPPLRAPSPPVLAVPASDPDELAAQLVLLPLSWPGQVRHPETIVDFRQVPGRQDPSSSSSNRLRLRGLAKYHSEPCTTTVTEEPCNVNANVYFHDRRENVYFRYGRVQLLPTTSREQLLPLRNSNRSENARFEASVSFRSCEDSFDFDRLSSSWTRSSS
ncbi:proline-rich protein 36 [Triticum aestivum]|uniref:proline-rich protein 36 n=1 Tax=Triticum aestivum TaxID=4565 RepID=UPI001D0083BF|nr:proline-rich protein 36-like [Triticum aestivum]